MLKQLDLTSLLILIFSGASIAVMIFAVLRHHLHRRALRRQEKTNLAVIKGSSVTPCLRREEIVKRPAAKVLIARKREGIR